MVEAFLDITTKRKETSQMHPDVMQTSDKGQHAELDPEEKTLVERWKNNDPEAFEQIIEIHGPYLSVLIGRRLTNASLSEDLVQEVWLRAHKKKGDYVHRAPFRSWLTRIAVNLAIKQNGKNSERNCKYLDENFPLAEADIQEAVINHVQAQGVIESMEAISTTNPRWKREMTAVGYKYLREMNYKEIAKAFGTSEGNARVLVSRGVDQLRRSFAQYA